MKKALRVLIALAVVTTALGGAFAMPVAAGGGDYSDKEDSSNYQENEDNDKVDVDAANGNSAAVGINGDADSEGGDTGNQENEYDD